MRAIHGPSAGPGWEVCGVFTAWLVRVARRTPRSRRFRVLGAGMPWAPQSVTAKGHAPKVPEWLVYGRLSRLDYVVSLRSWARG